MAYITFKGSTATVGVLSDSIKISPWSLNFLGFGKIKLPSSFSFTGLWSEWQSDEPRAAVLQPDDWDFFEAQDVTLFVTERDFSNRTVKIEAFPSDTLSAKLNYKLRNYAPQCWFDSSHNFDGDTKNWSAEKTGVKDSRGNDVYLPAFSLFGYKIVANDITKNVTSIYPNGATLNILDGTQHWIVNATASLPDKSIGELLYLSCYMGGFTPILRPPAFRSPWSARWYGVNLVADPFAVRSSWRLEATNDYAEFAFVNNINELNSLLPKIAGKLWLFASWDSTAKSFAGSGSTTAGQNGVNVGFVGSSKWAWFMDIRRRTVTINGEQKQVMYFADSFGSKSYMTAQPVGTRNGEQWTRWTAALYIGANCGFWIPSIHGTPSLKIYYNTLGITQHLKFTNVMCNIGIEPAPLSSETLNVSEFQRGDFFGLDYVSVWDCETELPDVNNITMGDEVHQASNGYARYSEGWTDPLLGFSKTGRSKSEDIVKFANNGKATTQHLMSDDGKPLTGLILLPRPEPQSSLSFARRFAMLRKARKVTFESSQKLNLLKLQPFLTGVCSLTSAKRKDAKTFNYEGVYLPAPADCLLSARQLIFPPWGGTKSLMGVRSLPLPLPNLGAFPVSGYSEISGCAVAQTLTVSAPLILRDFYSYVQTYDSSQTSNFGFNQGALTFSSAAAAVFAGASDSVKFGDDECLITVRGYTKRQVGTAAVNSPYSFTIDKYSPYIVFYLTVIPFSSDAKVNSLTITLDNDSVLYCQQRRPYVIYCTGSASQTLSWTAGNYGARYLAPGSHSIKFNYTLSTGSGTGSLNAFPLIVPVVND